VWNTDDLAVAAGHRVDPDRWRAHFDELMARIAGRFSRVEPRRYAWDLVLGLISDLPSKNCWTIAERAGHATPGGLQHMLARAAWDADKVRDDLRGYVTAHLGDQDAVLVVDETGDLKKGTGTAGAQRQYTGTAGRIENAQVAVYLTYASRGGHALIDRALYLPRSWTGDPARCAAAAVPGDVAFATKPELARQMITRALDGGAAARWVAGDEVYGADPGLRRELEGRGIGYVLAVSCRHRVTTAAGQQRADTIARCLPPRAWQRLSAGQGSKGPRFYDWAWMTIDPGAAGQRSLLIRRNIRTGELAHYRCYAAVPVPLAALVAVAGRRWTVEESFQAAKGLASLDQHQVRRWASWHRWTILAMPALAFLAVLAAIDRGQPPPAGMISLTSSEIHHLLNVLTTRPAPDPRHWLRWPAWRRAHQHRARTSHYQKRQQA
jgi:SRSO17 transposase